jgi:carbonic anhydrase
MPFGPGTADSCWIAIRRTQGAIATSRSRASDRARWSLPAPTSGPGLVPTYAPDAQAHGVSAALEYGVLALEVGSIVVLGHGRCGGIAAALDDAAPLSATDFVGRWVSELRDLAEDTEVVDQADPATRRLALERRSVERSLEHLRSFPWIRSREVAGSLALHGAWFDIELGELHELGPAGWSPVRR